MRTTGFSHRCPVGRPYSPAFAIAKLQIAEFKEDIEMKALVLEKYNDLKFEDVPEPKIGPDDVLVEVKACGICGSDVHGMDGSTGRRIPPLIMGHEASGVIAEVGANVSG